ncbi:MAG: hypothetical protein ACR2OL_12640 [Anderseniella sp.]
MSSKENNPGSEPSREEVEAALRAVVTSKEISRSVRLQEFLTYVVEETLSGAASRIRARTIAEDVYGRTSGTDDENESVVRVDAGRLRRRLVLYYLGSGGNDPIRIHIDSGGYAPRFERRETTSPAPADKHPFDRPFLIVGTFVVGGILAGAAVFTLGLNQRAEESTNKTADLEQRSNVVRRLEREAVFEQSPITLQAHNLAEQARGLIFPVFDPGRLNLTLGMFRRSTELDPAYSGGFAGAAQVLAFQAFLLPKSTDRTQLLHEARKTADKAVKLNPTDAWSQSAAAWVSFVECQCDQALRISERAVRLAPTDGHVLDIHALVNLFSGNFETAATATNPTISFRRQGQGKSIRPVIFAAANLHLGNYAKTAEAMQAAVTSGGAISPPMLAYLAAAHQAIGNTSEAQQAVRRLSTAWPEARIDLLWPSLFRHPEHAAQMIELLRAAGWKSPDPRHQQLPKTEKSKD